MIGISKLYCGTVEPSDALRYGRQAKHLPSHLLQFSEDKKPVVVWNCTQACNLKCVHCYAHAEGRGAPDEMTFAEGKALIDDLAAFGSPVILFSGGEPLCRQDMPALAEYAVAKGLRAVISTNGTLIDDAVAQRLKAIGLSYVGISLDGLRETNDHFRGVAGAYDRALEGLRACKRAGIKVGLRYTITKHNVADLAGIFDLLETEDIPRVCFYHLVYTGRGDAAADLSHAETRRVVDYIIDRTADFHARGLRKEVLTVDNHCDGPYLYLRLLKEGRAADAGRVMELLKMNGGNSSGHGFGCVSWDGAVYPDQFMRNHPLGNVRQRPFSAIWTDSSNALLMQFKNKSGHVTGKCKTCRFLDVCGGNFRARGETTGALWGVDPACYLSTDEIRTGPPQMIVAWEVTRRCALACRHCRGAARDCEYSGELATAECFKVIDALAAFARPMIILTGGEPLMRHDIFELARYATAQGCRVVLATCGHLLTAEIAGQLQAAGVMAVSLSLDAATAAAHDAFRGIPGAYDKTIAAVDHLKAVGIPFQINTTVSTLNAGELPQILDQAIALGAATMDFFFLVPTGRGSVMSQLALEPDARDRVLAWIADQARVAPIRIKTTCAPQYRKYITQEAQPDTSSAQKHPFRGCMGGRGFVFISHTGILQPCGFLDLPCGDLRAADFDFGKCYRESEVFRNMRTLDPFAGCPARAHARTGNYLAEECQETQACGCSDE